MRQPSAAQRFAHEATRLRSQTLARHRRCAPFEDLEDIYGQTVFELLQHAEANPWLASTDGAQTAIARRFKSRLQDHHRAVSGRSPSAHARATATPIDALLETAALPTCPDPSHKVVERERLHQIATAIDQLGADQRTALHASILGKSASELCRETGWSEAKARKTLQRARASLRAALEP